MIDALENAKFTHGHAAEALPFVGRSCTRVGIHPDAACDSETGVLGDEILPAVALAQQGAEEIVADAPIATRRPNTCLLHRSRGCARDIRINRCRTAQPVSSAPVSAATMPLSVECAGCLAGTPGARFQHRFSAALAPSRGK